MAQLGRSAAGLRIIGDDLIPSEITALLGVEPTLARIKGEKIVGAKTGLIRMAKTGAWHLDASSREPGDIDEQVAEIVGQLNPDLRVWEKLACRFHLDLFCGLFMDAESEGLSLSPQILRALGERGIELALCIYGPCRPELSES